MSRFYQTMAIVLAIATVNREQYSAAWWAGSAILCWMCFMTLVTCTQENRAHALNPHPTSEKS